MIKNVEVTIDRKVYNQIMWYVHKCPKEISGLGKIVLRNDKLHINKIYLPEQECTAVETELQPESVAYTLFESRTDEGELMFWWHSHVDMQTNWSGTDYECMKQLGGSGMILSTVFNKRHETRTALYIKGNGLKPDTFIDNLKLSIVEDFTPEEVAEMEKLYKERVTFPSPVVQGNVWTWNEGWQSKNKTKETKANGNKKTSSAPKNKGEVKATSNATKAYEADKAYNEKEWAMLSPVAQKKFLTGYTYFAPALEGKRTMPEFIFELERKGNEDILEEVMFYAAEYDFNMNALLEEFKDYGIEL